MFVKSSANVIVTQSPMRVKHMKKLIVLLFENIFVANVCAPALMASDLHRLMDEAIRNGWVPHAKVD